MSDVKQKLIQKYGPTILDDLRAASITAAGYKSAEPDIQEYLLISRPDDVERALNADRLDAANTKLAERMELTDFYLAYKHGHINDADVAPWLAENFSDDFVAFCRDFPQAESNDNYQHNIALMMRDIATRRVPPVYDELVKSFGRLASPERGYPTIALICPDGSIKTGWELSRAIKRYPMELLEPVKQARPAYETMSADEFLRSTPELQDNRQPALLKARFENEFHRFLKSDVGRAWKIRMAEVDAGEISTQIMWDLLKDRGSYSQKDFEDAAVASCDKFSVTLFKEDIGGVRTQGLELHDGGGSHHTQHSLGATMAGQIKPDAAEDTHVYSEAETRRLVRKLGSVEYRQLLNDSPNFRAAVDKYLGG
jgi:hypothetical protein